MQIRETDIHASLSGLVRPKGSAADGKLHRQHSCRPDRHSELVNGRYFTSGNAAASKRAASCAALSNQRQIVLVGFIFVAPYADDAKKCAVPALIEVRYAALVP